VTALTWTRTPSTPLPWEEALAYCETLDLVGQSDWRLPSFREFASILDWGRVEPLPAVVVTDGGPFWTSSPMGYVVEDPGVAVFDTGDGGATLATIGSPFPALCVRGGNLTPPP
jgi:hypothetical protein